MLDLQVCATTTGLQVKLTVNRFTFGCRIPPGTPKSVAAAAKGGERPFPGSSTTEEWNMVPLSCAHNVSLKYSLEERDN